MGLDLAFDDAQQAIRPDYIGQNIPTATDEVVRVRLEETDGIDEVAITRTGRNVESR